MTRVDLSDFRKQAKMERRLLNRGDHIFCIRSHAGYTYTHHGIYIEHDKVIHFSGETDFFKTCISMLPNGLDDLIDKEMKKENARYKEITQQRPTVQHEDDSHLQHMRRLAKQRPIHIRRTTLHEFRGNDTLHVAQYGEENTRYGCVIPIAIDRTVFLAEYYYNNPHLWKEYHLYSNNCETFACYCKTEERFGVQLQLHPENFCWREKRKCVIY